MLTLTKSLFALMIGFIIATVFGVMAIPFLKKIKAGQRINVYVDAHAKKSGTPTMGGIIFMISFQAILNLSVVIGLIPVTGVTLPFLSYGGSSLLITLIEMGIILNISRYQK